jgi:hypothetical protein
MKLAFCLVVFVINSESYAKMDTSLVFDYGQFEQNFYEQSVTQFQGVIDWLDNDTPEAKKQKKALQAALEQYKRWIEKDPDFRKSSVNQWYKDRQTIESAKEALEVARRQCHAKKYHMKKRRNNDKPINIPDTPCNDDLYFVKSIIIMLQIYDDGKDYNFDSSLTNFIVEYYHNLSVRSEESSDAGRKFRMNLREVLRDSASRDSCVDCHMRIVNAFLRDPVIKKTIQSHKIPQSSTVVEAIGDAPVNKTNYFNRFVIHASESR